MNHAKNIAAPADPNPRPSPASSRRGKLLNMAATLAWCELLVNLRSGEGVFSFKTAFDEAFSRFSPGVLLQIENYALLDRPGLAWADSCAAPDHPMIDSLWTALLIICLIA